MSKKTYYIPHEALIFTNQESVSQFNAEKILPAYDTYIKNATRLCEPWEVEIHLSGHCPFSCKECSYATRHSGKELGLHQIEKVFSALSKETHFVFFSGGGDPFAWTSWNELLRLRDKYIPYTPIGVSTNLFGLPNDIDLNKIDLFQVHVSGFNRESFMEQIGIDVFDVFANNLSRVCNSNSKITLKVILNEYVHQNFVNFLNFFIGYDVDNIIFKLPQNFLSNEIYLSQVDYAKIYEIALSHLISDKYDLIINNIKDVIFDNDIIADKCYFTKSGLYCLIREDGSVFPCVASTHSAFNSMGNINENTLSDILNAQFNEEVYNENMLCGKCPLKACRHYRFNKVIKEKYNKNNQYTNQYMPLML